MTLPNLESFIDTNAWEVIHTVSGGGPTCNPSSVSSISSSPLTSLQKPSSSSLDPSTTTPSIATTLRVEARRIETIIHIPREHHTCCYARLQLATRLAHVNKALEASSQRNQNDKEDCNSHIKEKYHEYSNVIRDVMQSIQHAAAAGGAGAITPADQNNNHHNLSLSSSSLSSSFESGVKRPRSSLSHGNNETRKIHAQNNSTSTGGSPNTLSMEYVNCLPSVLRNIPGVKATVTFHLSAFITTTTAKGDDGEERLVPLPPFLGYRRKEVEEQRFETASSSKANDQHMIELLPLIKVHRTRTLDDDDDDDNALSRGTEGQEGKKNASCSEWEGVYLPFSVEFPLHKIAAKNSPPNWKHTGDVLSHPSEVSTGIHVDVYSVAPASKECQAAYRHFAEELLQQTFVHGQYYPNLQRFALNPHMRTRDFKSTPPNATTLRTKHRNALLRTFDTHKNSLVWQHAALIRTRHGIPIEVCMHPTASVLSAVLPKKCILQSPSKQASAYTHTPPDTNHLSGLSTLADLLHALQRQSNGNNGSGHAVASNIIPCPPQ